MRRCRPWPKPETAQEKSLTPRVERLTIWLTILRPTVRSFFTPLSVSAPFYWYLNLHKKGRSQKKDLRWHLEIELGTSDFLHGRQHTYQLYQSLILSLYLLQLFNATKTGIWSTLYRLFLALPVFHTFNCTTVVVKPRFTDTSLIRTLSMVPSVSVLMAFDCNRHMYDWYYNGNDYF